MTNHHVSIGEVVATADPSDQIRMIGLGSCAGVFLVVPGRFAVAAHVLLPTKPPTDAAPPGKYADTAIPYLIGLLERAGHDRSDALTTVVGGAQVFQFSGSRPEFEVGSRNTAEVVEQLSKFGIKPDHTDIGGSKARSLTISVATGEMV